MQKEIKIDILRCLSAVICNWYWVILCGIVCTGFTLAFTINRPNTYFAKTTMYSAVYGSYTQTIQSNTVMQTYLEIVNSQKVAERAAILIGENRITGDEIANMVSVFSDSNSALLYIYAKSINSDLAVEVANAIAESFAIEAQSITGDNTVQILDKADKAYIDGMPDYLKYGAISLIISIFLPILVICMKEIISDNVYHVEDASIDGQLDIIGIIPIEEEM